MIPVCYWCGTDLGPAPGDPNVPICPHCDLLHGCHGRGCKLCKKGDEVLNNLA